MTESSSERRLLAIMFTDVVGYSALTERDEAGAVRVRDAHRELVHTLVKQFDGEVIDATGDESLSIFGSALQAVDCALALQGALRSHPALRVRIGIHLGDVLRRDGEVIGEGVNVAARIRPLAEPGGICVSEPVYQMVRSRAQVRARALGPKSLKNMEQPLAVYALDSEEVAGAQAAGRSRRKKRWIAVVAAAVFLALGTFWIARAPLVAWLALNVPRVMGASVEQQIAFAETPDGVRIAYATSGTGPPLVFVLGWGTHLTEGMGSALYDQSGFLGWHSRDHTVVRYDGRGFGLSDRNVEDFSLEARLRDLETVVDAAGLERFDLYAFSAGGPAGVAFAARHPERVSRLVLAATYKGGYGGDGDRRRALTDLTRFAGANWDTNVGRASFIEFLAPQANEVQRRLLMHFLSVAAEGPQILGFFLAGGEIDVAPEAGRIRVPTLVVAGDADTTIPVTASRELASLIPDARFEIVEGATHIGASGQDSRVKRLVTDFLATPVP